MDKFNVDSQTRRNMLAEIVGKENAEQVNTIYEKNLLLKNQEAAMYRTVAEISGVAAAKKSELAAKIKQTYAEKNRRLYEPTELENHLNEITSDIYSKKYNTEVSLEQAQTITELAQDAKVAKEELTKSGKKGYGAAKVALDNYTNTLRLEAVKSDLINPIKETGAAVKAKAVMHDARVSVNFIAENSRAIVASLDNSLWFRQGMRALSDWRTSKIWAANFAKSWKDIAKTIYGATGEKETGLKDFVLGKDAIKAGDMVTDAVKAEIYDRPNFVKGLYEGKPGKGTAGTKLDIGTGEEAYPTSWPSKIPIFGRFFKGSEVAYEAGAMRLRADIADKVYEMAKKSGADLTDNQTVGDLNEVINGMTGRGSFGKRAGGFERATNKAIFSIKFFKANLDYLTVHQGRLSTPATKLAAQNLLNTVLTTTAVMTMARAFLPDDNKDIFNPRSSNFGKIRSGPMTFDLTHGAGGIVVAMSRLLPTLHNGEWGQWSTNATTGITKKLGEGYGSSTGMDIIWNFIEGKLSPAASVLRDVIKQKTYSGKKPTIGSEVAGLTVPISVQNVYRFRDEPAARRILGLIADGIGINTNVQNPATDWGESNSKEMEQFRAQVGDAAFKYANEQFNKQYSDYLQSIRSIPEQLAEWNNLDDEQKQNALTLKKSMMKKEIFRKFNFKSQPTREDAIKDVEVLKFVRGIE